MKKFIPPLLVAALFIVFGQWLTEESGFRGVFRHAIMNATALSTDDVLFDFFVWLFLVSLYGFTIGNKYIGAFYSALFVLSEFFVIDNFVARIAVSGVVDGVINVWLIFGGFLFLINTYFMVRLIDNKYSVITIVFSLVILSIVIRSQLPVTWKSGGAMNQIEVCPSSCVTAAFHLGYAGGTRSSSMIIKVYND